LTTILAPSLLRSKKQAQSISCLGNLKDWGLIFEMYAEQNEQRFFSGPLDTAWDDWVEILEPYYDGKEEIMCCPLATKTRAKGGQGVFAAWDDGEGDYGSFGLNAWICDARKGIVFGQDYYWRSSGAAGAGRIPVLLDSIGIAGWPDTGSLPPEFNGQPTGAPTLAEQMKPLCIDRHGNGTDNVLFMDWSAGPVGLKELWTLKWHPNFKTNGPWTQAGGAKPESWPEWLRPYKDY
jgi:hypothetical protein